jgi:hypothetical protein
MQNHLLPILMLLLSASANRAEEGGPIRLDFVKPVEGEKNVAVTQGPAAEPAIEVTGQPGGSTTTVVICDEPPLASHDYLVRGRVKYDGVSPDGYLELLNNFGPQGEFFTRTLAPWGPMGKLSGTGSWRTFELPFHANPGMRPKRLTLNVVLPGAGKVTIAEAVLLTRASSGEWWTEQQAGMLGGGLGVFLGTLGALIGFLSSRTKARSLTMALFAIGLTFSAFLLLAGIVAACLSQPWHVCYPLLLAGVIGLGVLGPNLWILLKRFQADELRRMAAADA